MLKRNSVVFFIVVIVAGLGSAASYAGENVRLQLKWVHSWQFAGYYAAQKKGFYADAGLNVTINERSLQHNHIDTVLAGNAEYGVADSSIVLHRLNGRPIVALAAIFQHSPLVLMTLAKDGLIGPHELKGKRVMYQRGVDDAVITAMFTLLGIPDDYFQYLEHRLDDDALLRGETDAISAYLTNQPLMYERRGYQVNIINPANYGIDFYGDTLFTSEAELKEHPDRVKRFIAASLKGWSYAVEHKSEVSQWLREDFGIKRSKELLMAEAEAVERMIIPKLVEIGYLNPERYGRIAEIYKELGMAKPKAKITGIYIDDYSQKPYSFEQWIKWAVASCLFLLLLLIVVLGINRRLNRLVKERTQALYQIANTDHLTGINNRKSLENVLNNEISRTDRYLHPFVVMLVDVDYFKRINDSYGHQEGDKVLICLSSLLSKAFRRTDSVGRWGGEEFLVVCPELDQQTALKLAELFRDKIEQYDFGVAGKVTVSIGLAMHEKGGTMDSLISRVDNALYQAKDGGRNRVVMSD